MTTAAPRTTSGTETTAAPANAETPATPEVEGPITGPGATFLDPLEQGFPASASAAASGYVVEDYIVWGTEPTTPTRCGSR